MSETKTKKTQKTDVKKTERPKIPAEAVYATGRRKQSIAKVWGFPGKGNVYINGMLAADYLGHETYLERLTTGLRVLGLESKFDFVITVLGGGKSGQADAGRLGIARVLLASNETFREKLRENHLLTRDSRVKERKKYGRRGARKMPQYRKR